MCKLTEEIESVRKNAECLFDASEVCAAYDQLAEEISETLSDRTPLVLAVLTGGLIPTGELITRLDFPLELDYLHATRYQGNTRGRELNWIAHPSSPMQGRAILVIDDILDEGLTLDAILHYCRTQGAEEVLSAVLVEKQHDRRNSNIQATFTGLSVDDRYVFGCGMDYKGFLRNLPEIYAINNEVIK